ncbi:hypothetical protein SAMN06295937_100261 [Sphingopyxis flava]|uniref:Uncharacterized protein n=1 Tax=Sphingopyxis flava TaxID=1507287 RepID=A0A1T5A0C9_9SPHN|nr:hypothetical protein SAMN06295937_100261 [Sphingopyxis flava]
MPAPISYGWSPILLALSLSPDLDPLLQDGKGWPIG